eukprot:scaffold383572_cov34-Prasinocladus_malaysianus.AAC.3
MVPPGLMCTCKENLADTTELQRQERVFACLLLLDCICMRVASSQTGGHEAHASGWKCWPGLKRARQMSKRKCSRQTEDGDEQGSTTDKSGGLEPGRGGGGIQCQPGQERRGFAEKDTLNEKGGNCWVDKSRLVWLAMATGIRAEAKTGDRSR